MVMTTHDLIVMASAANRLRGAPVQRATAGPGGIEENGSGQLTRRLAVRKYQITRLLGMGGGGAVYEAYDTGKGRTVAS